MDISDNQKIYTHQKFTDQDCPNKAFNQLEFDSCTFINCNFSETAFSKCRFVDCSFNDCNLSLIKVEGTRFNNVNFVDSKLLGINWTKTSWPTIQLTCPLQFHRCILDHNTFLGMYLREIVIQECKINEADFREADLSYAMLNANDFLGSFFNETNLSYADLSGSDNYFIDIFNNKIKKAKFSLPGAMNLLAALDIEII